MRSGFRPPSFFALTLGWALVSFNLIVLGSTLAFSLQAISNSFNSPTTAVAFAFYVWFAAPVLLAIGGSVFVRSILAESRGAAKSGLLASLGVLGIWVTMLAIQFGANARW